MSTILATFTACDRKHMHKGCESLLLTCGCDQRAMRVGSDLFGRLVEVGSEDDAGARVLEKILGLLHVGAEQANHQRN